MTKISDLIDESNQSVYVVAEIGINHNSDLKLAKKMIRAASLSGVDAVKFQTIIPEELFSKVDNPELFKMSNDWILSKKQHIELIKYANQNKIDFFSTPFGNKSVKMLRELHVKMIKIASSDMDNFDLLENSIQNKVPLVVSTGMSTFQEIAKTVEFIKNRKRKFILLHCNSAYPTKPEDVNLSSIPHLKKCFGVPVGYSDHTLGIDACVSSVMMGACMLEKHFTLDKDMKGPDQKLSGIPEEFKEMVERVRQVEKFLGKPRENYVKSEEQFREKMRKSIHVTQNLKKGTKIKKSMLSLVRPGTGIPPSMLDKIVGMVVQNDIKKGIMLKWTNF